MLKWRENVSKVLTLDLQSGARQSGMDALSHDFCKIPG